MFRTRTCRRTCRGKTCEANKGIIDEGEEIIASIKARPLLTLGSCLAVEYHRMMRYGILRRWARELGMTDPENLLATTLEEESQTDEDLTSLTEKTVNEAAQTAKAA